MSVAQKIENTKKIKYIDCDVHPLIDDIQVLYPYISEHWIKRFEMKKIGLNSLRLPDRYAHPASGTLRPDAVPPSGGKPGTDPQYVKEHYLDVHNPELVVLNPMQPATLVAWTDTDAVSTLVSAFNDYYINEWLGVDDRFRYAMVVAPQDPIQAAAEIRRVGSTKGVSAVFLPLLNILLGNKHYYPIYEAAVDMGLPIISHPTGTECSYHGTPVVAGGVPTSYIERYVDLPQIGQSNVSSLIFEGVFERYPTLKVAFAEFGFSWLLSLIWRMDKGWKELRIETPWVKQLPSEYIRSNIRFTTQPLDEPERMKDLKSLIEMINGDQILMFSSDYPHWDNDMASRSLPFLTNEEKKKIFYENAKEFYHL
jgi:predicted TIM-barrel fold metal-dependent hydrolase